MGETNYKEGLYVTIFIVLVASAVGYAVLVGAFGEEDNYCEANQDGLYDCVFSHGNFTVMQKGLDQADIDTLWSIWKAKADGTYVRPPVQ